MKILWLCNIMLPMIAEQLHMEASNKEGWLSGLASAVLERRGENHIELAVAFPGPSDLGFRGGTAQTPWGELKWYSFKEYVGIPEVYDSRIEEQLLVIAKSFEPDVVHCFGTEYPHTLAMCRVFPEKNRLLVGIQGLCGVYANAYFASLPNRVIFSATLRDFLKRDNIRQQRYKFMLRGEMEYMAVQLAGNVTGRTAWDKHYTAEWNPEARYYKLNETLRPDFYQGQWRQEYCEKNSIFLSQGDYPIKGLHYMLTAMPAILEKIPDAKVYVAGNNIVGDGSWKSRLKISAYGRYLRRLIRKNRLQERVCFLGRLNAAQMKQQYLKSNLFVCCSSIENSPNSLGEAMLLGVPCVSADVGGIASLFTDKKDGILYEAYRTPENSFDNMRYPEGRELSLKEISANLAKSVTEMLLNQDLMNQYAENARIHAKITHSKEENYNRMTEIYSEITKRNEGTEKPTAFVFVSNYINHHQIPLCNALYELLEGNFVFIQTEPMEDERVRMGWETDEELPYVKYFYREKFVCEKLIAESKVVLFGGTDDESYIAERLQSGRPVVRYSERLYKEGQWKAISPRGLIEKYFYHTRYRHESVYMLCAGAYVPSDFHIVRAYPRKMLKWGYFPATRHYDVDQLMREKEPASILWAGRFLDWKHPEAALECAAYLKARGLRFRMKLVGDGEMRPLVEKLVREYDLGDCVTLLGYRKPDEVRALMERSQIYLATSDRMEGWGAVINEAMNSGCAVVASHMMGAAPFLIRQGENGVLYRDGRQNKLNESVERLLGDPVLCENLGRTAIGTIEQEWNAENAAAQLLLLLKKLDFLKERDVKAALLLPQAACRSFVPPAGPCSDADVVSERKMPWKIL